jgi:5'-nucleotidase
MPDGPLIVGVSTRALFDLEEEHAVFAVEGLEAYERMQRQREAEVLKPGAAFEVVKRLLALNERFSEALVEIVFLSRNSPDLSLRAFHSAKHYGLKITRGSFTSGRSVAPYSLAWGVDLFLSNDDEDVRAAAQGGAAAARLCARPNMTCDTPEDEVRVALDGDSVVFGPESDLVYKEKGLAAFLAHETSRAGDPMSPGPLGNFFQKLAALRERCKGLDGTSLIRIALITARNAPSHERVIKTFRAWGTPADEVHFVGAFEKGPIIKAFGAHIFFDDQERHVLGAAAQVAAGLVPGPHDPATLVIQAES